MWEDLIGGEPGIVGLWAVVVACAGLGLWHMTRPREPADPTQDGSAGAPVMPTTWTHLTGADEDGDFPDPATNELLDLAHEQAMSGLSRQSETVERLRNRAMTFVAALAAIVAVFGDSVTKGGGSLALAIVAAGAAVASLVCGIAIAAPQRLAFGLKPAKLLEDTTWRNEKRPREWAIRELGHWYRHNGDVLDRMHGWHRLQLSTGGLAVASAVAYVATARAGG